ncbi:hypothetical protein [Streptomyces sp. NBC_00154]|uniref:hypothetical protein n=1 Tax=Streptomyces sp. NBC_00154 TaxID=2975670 RepID=UPI00225B79B3|nr:hypothetical protein [Streptomyces sp. NBC_00154]MCX5316430.1 hypothetical protein [Streptomyces sp. NBC_00154]
MTLTLTDVRTGLSLPGSAVEGTGTGRHRGTRADEDGWVPEGDFAAHGRHRRIARTAWLPPADGPEGTDHDAAHAPVRDGSVGLGREHRVADGLAALEALMLQNKTLQTDRAQDL